MPLSNAKVKALKDPGKHSDGLGLVLNISKGGTKSWIQRITVKGKRKDIGLGGYPKVSLKQAREWRDSNRALVAIGRAPLSALDRKRGKKAREVNKPQTPTFEAEARLYHSEKMENIVPRNRLQWIQRAEQYLFPILGDMPVNKIRPYDLYEILQPLALEKSETAHRLKIICNQTFQRAVFMQIIPSNPVQALAGQLPKRVKSRAIPHRSTPFWKVSRELRKVELSTAHLTTKLAFKFMVLNAQRPSETRFLEWEDVDFDNAMLTIPAERMKMRQPHRIPMSRQSLDLLRQAYAVSWHSRYIFPSQATKKDVPLTKNTLHQLAVKLNLEGTPHGYRASFKTWATESGREYDAVELSLAHVLGSEVERVYFRGSMQDQRRKIMQDWADFVEKDKGNTLGTLDRLREVV